MRFLLNIFLVFLVTFSPLAAQQLSTKSTRRTQVKIEPTEAVTQNGQVGDAKKSETGKQEVPPPKAKDTKKQEVPPPNKGNDKAEEKKQEQPQGKVEKVNTPVVNMNFDGIDVSRHQKTIDWDAVAAEKKVQYVYIKATEGQSYVDPKYRENIENARRVGIKVGSYHFLRTGTSVHSQFENFKSVVNKNEQDLLPLLDVEVKQGWTSQQMRDSVKVFVDLLEEHYGCKPMIYTGASFFNNNLGRLFIDYPLFIARYASNEPRVENAKWTLWQFSDKGRIAGIDHAVDLSRFNKGCSLKDILIKDNKIGHQKRRNSDVVDKSREKPSAVNVKKEAPAMSKQQEKELKKQQEKEQKARERAEKLAKEDEKRREKEAKEQEKKDARSRAVRQRVQTNLNNSQDNKKALEQAEKEAKEREKAAAKERAKREKEAKEKAKREKEERAKAEKSVDKMLKEYEKEQAKEREREAKEREKAEKEREKAEKEREKEAAKEKAIAEKRAKAAAKAKAELEKEKQEEAAKAEKQQKQIEKKAKMQQQKAASTQATTTQQKTNTEKSSATPTRKRTNKSSTDNDD